MSDPRIPPPCPWCGHPVWHHPECHYEDSLTKALSDLAEARAELLRQIVLAFVDEPCLALCERFPRTNFPTWVLESAARAYRERDV